MINSSIEAGGRGQEGLKVFNYFPIIALFLTTYLGVQGVYRIELMSQTSYFIGISDDLTQLQSVDKMPKRQFQEGNSSFDYLEESVKNQIESSFRYVLACVLHWVED